MSNWIPALAVKRNRDGSISVLTPKGRQRNPAGFGFRDATGLFHPINDPDPSYVKSVSGGKKRKKSKAKARKTRKVKRVKRAKAKRSSRRRR